MKSASLTAMYRRTFFRQTLALSAAALPGVVRAAGSPANTLCFFTKHLQGLSFEELAAVAAESGMDGVEVPVRPKGHVLPERVEDDLPKLVEALRAHDQELTILTSGINEVSAEQRTEPVLRTAAALGVKRFRMLYYKYDLAKPIWAQLEEIRPKVKDLVQLCREIGIQPLFQNHSGSNYVGAGVWDAYHLMRDYPVDEFAFAFDIRHASVEGGLSWPQEAALVRDHMGAVYFKDYVWEGRKAANCPLGQGQVSPDFAAGLMKRGYTGPISLHLEYLEGDPLDPVTLAEFKAAHVRDGEVLKGWLTV